MIAFQSNRNLPLLLKVLLLSFCATVSNAQEEFPEFKDYRSLGFNISPVLYAAARTTRSYGNYTLDNKKTFNVNFGFDYLIHPERKWAFKTGLHMDIIPMYNYEYTIKQGDIYPEYGNYHDTFINRYKLNFTIPLLAEIKKQMAYNLYFNLEAGFHFTIMQAGGFDVAQIFRNADESEAREVFALYANAGNPTCVYPNLIISPGFYLMLYGVMLQGNVVYQKPIVPFFKGEYQFGNLLSSGPTRGNYKLTGEYIGLSLSVYLLKRN